MLRVFTFVLGFFVLCYFLNLHIILSKASFYFNTFCIGWSPNSGHFHALYLALSCGVKDYSSSFFEFFRQLGLVHLLVVSGAHLAFVEKWLVFRDVSTRSFQFWPLVVLVFYVLLSGAQPPVVRALFFYIFCLFNRAHQLNYSVFQCSVAGSVGVSLLFPHWLGGWSLALSVLASLLVHLPVRVGPVYLGTSFMAVCTRMYVGLLPALVVFGLPHPVSIVVNWAFTPVFTVLLFPLSLLAYAVGWLSAVTDMAWRLTYFVLQSLGVPPASPPADFQPWYLVLLWLYILALTGLGLWAERQS